MSTPLSLSTPKTRTVAAAPATTEQVTFWTVMGVISAAAVVGVLEVALHLIG